MPHLIRDGRRPARGIASGSILGVVEAFLGDVSTSPLSVMAFVVAKTTAPAEPAVLSAAVEVAAGDDGAGNTGDVGGQRGG